MNKDKNYKYLTIFLIIGFIVGACVGVYAWTIFNQNAGLSIAIGAGLGMLCGIVIGAVIDYENMNKM